jgi:hypothetical protein
MRAINGIILSHKRMNTEGELMDVSIMAETNEG